MYVNPSVTNSLSYHSISKSLYINTIISLKTDLLSKSIKDLKYITSYSLWSSTLKTAIYKAWKMLSFSCGFFLSISIHNFLCHNMAPILLFCITAKNIKGQPWFNVKGFLRWSKAFQNSPSKEQAKITCRLYKRTAFLLIQLYHLNLAKSTNS